MTRQVVKLKSQAERFNSISSYVEDLIRRIEFNTEIDEYVRERQTQESKRLGAVVTSRMQDLGLSQSELARLSRVSEALITGFCDGTYIPYLDSLQKIASALKCDLCFEMRSTTTEKVIVCSLAPEQNLEDLNRELRLAINTLETVFAAADWSVVFSGRASEQKQFRAELAPSTDHLFRKAATYLYVLTIDLCPSLQSDFEVS